MSNLRLAPRLDIKGENLIKGIHLEGLRVVGSPKERALKYYNDGADEIIYMDIVASLYGRNSLKELILETVRDIFIPVTVGGGIRSIADARDILRAGADKIAINTAAVNEPELISRLAKKFGKQCVVVSIEAKKKSDDSWEVYTDNGREKTGLCVVEWARKVVELGAGEILLTSVDREGTKRGFDVELVKRISDSVSVPVIASGGMGCLEHLLDVVKQGGADAVAMADVLHYDRLTLQEVRAGVLQNGIATREIR